MGGAAIESGGGKKKSLDFELNLVPFIDLLSCLISFLLITATWSQLVRIQTSQKTSSGPPPKTQPDKVMVSVLEAGYDLKLPGDTEPKRIGRIAGAEYNWKELKQKIDETKKRLPELSIAGISVEDTVPYEEVSRVMDICSGLGLKALSLAQERPPEPGAAKPAGGGG